MGRYITRTDVEAVFGVDNVATWSNLENTQASANEDRIDAAIARAEGCIDDRFRGGTYAVPLSNLGDASSAVVKDWASNLAGAWLFESRGLRDDDPTAHRMAERRRRIDREMVEYLSGQRRLDAARATTGPGAPSVIC